MPVIPWPAATDKEGLVLSICCPFRVPPLRTTLSSLRGRVVSPVSDVGAGVGVGVGVKSVVRDTVLLLESGSATAEVTLAVLIKSPADADSVPAVATIITAALFPLSTRPRSQVMAVVPEPGPMRL